MEPVRLTYNIDGANFTAAGEASTSVKRVLKKIGIPSDIIRRTGICMYEGEINMVIHANGGEITVDIDPEAIVITLRDTGPGIANVAKAMEEGFSTATESIRDMGFGAGMGLPNMKRNSDEFYVNTTVGLGTTVEMKIYLNQNGEAGL